MKKPYLIGIAGGSGAGKTFFLRALREHFDEDILCIISQDNYYRPANEQAVDEMGYINFDRPEGIDKDAFLKDIESLSRNKTVIRQEYMFNQPGIVGQMIELKPAPVIIIEGLFIFHFPEIREILNLKIFMESHHLTRLARRLGRDTKERGVTEELILYQWENHVMPAYEKFLLPHRGEADLIIDNDGPIEVPIQELVKIIKNKTGKNSD